MSGANAGRSRVGFWLQMSRWIGAASLQAPRRKGLSMIGRRSALLLSSLMVAGLVLAACGGSNKNTTSTSTNGSPSGSITVFAAASLTSAFEALGTDYMAAHKGTTVGFNFAGSNTLAEQINQGAPVDVFASADPKNMSDAAGELNAPQTFAKNELIVILPAKNPGKIESLKDLANPGVTIAVADPSVPIGGYTLDVLNKMGQSSAYGPAYEKAVKGNFVTQETSVSGIVQKVLLGEVDAGYVYVSDAVANGSEVKSITIPTQYNIVADYPIATAKHTSNPTTSESFVAYVLSPPGQKVLGKYGFLPA
jgi:molybdate transport system substrate-binding protein